MEQLEKYLSNPNALTAAALHAAVFSILKPQLPNTGYLPDLEVLRPTINAVLQKILNDVKCSIAPNATQYLTLVACGHKQDQSFWSNPYPREGSIERIIYDIFQEYLQHQSDQNIHEVSTPQAAG